MERGFLGMIRNAFHRVWDLRTGVDRRLGLPNQPLSAVTDRPHDPRARWFSPYDGPSRALGGSLVPGPLSLGEEQRAGSQEPFPIAGNRRGVGPTTEEETLSAEQ